MLVERKDVQEDEFSEFLTPLIEMLLHSDNRHPPHIHNTHVPLVQIDGNAFKFAFTPEQMYRFHQHSITFLSHARFHWQMTYRIYLCLSRHNTVHKHCQVLAFFLSSCFDFRDFNLSSAIVFDMKHFFTQFHDRNWKTQIIMAETGWRQVSRISSLRINKTSWSTR